MGFSYRYRFAVEFTTVTGSMTPAGWNVKSSNGRRGPVHGNGKPNAANLATYVADLNASMEPGGVNDHLGAGSKVIAARIVDHDNGRVSGRNIRRLELMDTNRAMRVWMVREAMAGHLARDVFEPGTGRAIATKLAEAYAAAHPTTTLDECDPVWDAAIEAAEEIDTLVDQEDRPKRKLTRNERLQAAADRGFDTWDDYNGDR